MVQRAWNSVSAPLAPVRNFRIKLAAVGKELRAWAQVAFSKKDTYLGRSKWVVQQLDRVEEKRNLNDHERGLRIKLREHIFHLALISETKWKQRSGNRWLQLGDKNTKYFHASANGRKNANAIEGLQRQDGSAIAQQDLREEILKYYENLLGRTGRSQTPFDLTGKVGPCFAVPLAALDENITQQEVRLAVMELPKNKASGPDGFPAEFYQNFWDIMAPDIMKLIDTVQSGTSDISSINKAAITIIRKKENLREISDYRPISVINTSVKIITKILSKRLQPNLGALISANQTAFVKGRSIMESFLVAREFLNSYSKRKIPSVLFKVDFEKAFDTTNWCFLINLLIERGFPPKWISMVLLILKSSESTIRSMEN